ncbi:MAG: hypothetical protein CMJ89_10990 [Planctomycetes bacterium]|nr:hypothetical protein [Planctomycetota bacterium]
MADDRRTELRVRLGDARLMLIFTPEVCRGGEPLGVLDSLLALVDVIQVRVKDPRQGSSPARELYDWTARVLESVRGSGHAPLVIVNDRIDVALALKEEGVAGVHLGTEDSTPEQARELLGDVALVGLSTHSAYQVAAAQDRPVDYLGFGPVFPSTTKGYSQGLGPEAAWIASQASGVPVFAIGGIDFRNIAQIAEVGRAAVSSALLCAEDPARTARGMADVLGG